MNTRNAQSLSRRILTLPLIVAAAAGLWGLGDLALYKHRVASLTVADVPLTAVSDGTYEGASDTGWVAAQVKVTVQDHRITGIDLLEHKNGRGTQAESVLNAVLDRQTLQVDTVSGATASSKVLLKAVENALSNGVRQ